MRVPPPPPLSPDDATKRFDLEPPSLDVVPKGKDDPDALSAALETVLQDCRRTGTTAVIAHTDYHAARLVEVAESMNMAIPRDLALIAYDDELADSARVPLTALTAPRLEVGRTALALLLERLEPARSHPAVRHVELLPRLTVRESCGCGPSGPRGGRMIDPISSATTVG